MPELPTVLLTSEGNVLDSRAALYALLRRIIDTANLMRPAADFVAANSSLADDARDLADELFV
jgi:hypothetical protein